MLCCMHVIASSRLYSPHPSLQVCWCRNICPLPSGIGLCFLQANLSDSHKWIARAKHRSF